MRAQLTNGVCINGFGNKSPGNGKYCFQIHGLIYHFLLPLYPKKAYKPGYVQLYIFNNTKATKPAENKSNKACITEVTQ
jgi:hypothetical protein